MPFDIEDLAAALSEEDPDDPDLASEKEALVERCLSVLNPRERDIMEKIAGLNGNYVHSLSEIAREQNISRQRIFIIKERAKKKILKSVSLDK